MIAASDENLSLIASNLQSEQTLSEENAPDGHTKRATASPVELKMKIETSSLECPPAITRTRNFCKCQPDRHKN